MAILRVIAWNVFEGHRPEHVRAELTDMTEKYHPDVIVLTEASGQFGHLEGLGYTVAQLDPGAWRSATHRTETGNVAVLVREGLAGLRKRILRMSVRWLGPKHGIPHDPRVYRWVRFRKGGKVWKVGGYHIPFGAPARRESFERIKRWFKQRSRNGRPVIAVGDMNMRADDYRSTIADEVGATVAGRGIDLTAYKNCKMLWRKSLGKRGSDHPAMLYVYKA